MAAFGRQATLHILRPATMINDSHNQVK